MLAREAHVGQDTSSEDVSSISATHLGEAWTERFGHLRQLAQGVLFRWLEKIVRITAAVTALACLGTWARKLRHYAEGRIMPRWMSRKNPGALALLTSDIRS